MYFLLQRACVPHPSPTRRRRVCFMLGGEGGGMVLRWLADAFETVCFVFFVGLGQNVKTSLGVV